MWYWTNRIEKRHHRFGYRERFRRNVVGNGDLNFKTTGLWMADIEALRISVHLLKSSTSVIQADAEIRAWWWRGGTTGTIVAEEYLEVSAVLR
jgi:hypothetical protein